MGTGTERTRARRRGCKCQLRCLGQGRLGRLLSRRLAAGGSGEKLKSMQGARSGASCGSRGNNPHPTCEGSRETITILGNGCHQLSHSADEKPAQWSPTAPSKGYQGSGKALAATRWAREPPCKCCTLTSRQPVLANQLSPLWHPRRPQQTALLLLQTTPSPSKPRG